jgi:hypothetical protein
VEPIPVTVARGAQKNGEDGRAGAAGDAKPSDAPSATSARRSSPLDQAAFRRSKWRANAQALRALRSPSSASREAIPGKVQVLRMEALKQSGENAPAALAKKFLAEHPNSPT